MNKNAIRTNQSQLAWRISLFHCITLKSFIEKRRYQMFSAIFINFILCIIPLLGFVPIICSFLTDWDVRPYLLLVFICSLILVIDFFFRMLTFDLYFNEQSFFSAIRHHLFSIIFSSFSSITGIAFLIIFFSWGTFSPAGITLTMRNSDIYTIIFTVLLIFNLFPIYSRLILNTTNSENLKIFRRIFRSRYKTLFAILILMIIICLLFSFIIYSFETYSSLPGDDVRIISMGDAVYYTLITMSTVGFGDMYTVTTGGRAFTIVLSIIGVCVYALISSVFVNFFADFASKKQKLQEQARNNKAQELDTRYMLSSIDSIVLKNLLEAKVLSKEQYDEILINRYKTEKKEFYEFNKDDFIFDVANKTILFKSAELGVHNHNIEDIKKAEATKWFALRTIPMEIAHKAVLYAMPIKMINTIKNDDYNFPVIFSSKNFDQSINKLIVYQKTPFKSVLFEINLVAIMKLEKNEAWHYFGEFTNLKLSKFNSLFSKSKTINVLLVKDIILYNNYKLLESYGINFETKLEEITYLK